MNKLLEKVNEAFGFPVEIISTKEHDGVLRITVKRPNGKKFYHAFQYTNGVVVAV